MSKSASKPTSQRISPKNKIPYFVLNDEGLNYVSEQEYIHKDNYNIIYRYAISHQDKTPDGPSFITLIKSRIVKKDYMKDGTFEFTLPVNKIHIKSCYIR